MALVVLVVRRPVLADAAAIAALHRASALVGFAGIFPPEAPVPTIEDLKASWSTELTRAGHLVLVVDAGSELVGVTAAGADPDGGGAGHLSRLYVAPPWWGQGIGRRLHDLALGHLRRQRYAHATLWVLEGNQRARAWYERLGWDPTAARKATYAPGGVYDIGYRRRL